LTVSNSTIAANTIRGGDGGAGGTGGAGGASQGGGLYVQGKLTVSNSTVSSNALGGGNGGSSLFSGNGGNGGAGQGGGLWVDYATGTSVSFSTIATNRVTGGTHGNGGHGDGTDGRAMGGGLHNQPTRLIETSDTIMAENTVNGPGTNSGPDLSGYLGSLGYNLIGNSEGGGGFDVTDLLDVNPLLGALQENGGLTQTIGLFPGSPALNAGDPGQLGVPDQRGVVRSGGVNIGAYQASATVFVLDAPPTVTAGVPFDVTVTAVDPFGQVAVGYSGTVTFSTTDTDSGVVLPADYMFTADDGGLHTFTDTGLGETTLITPGDQMLTVTDTADGTITGSANVTVEPGGSAPAHDGSPRPFGRGTTGVAIPVQNLQSSSMNAALERFFAALAEEESTFRWRQWRNRDLGEPAGSVLDFCRQEAFLFL
jgi:hypothetical protein